MKLFADIGVKSPESCAIQKPNVESNANLKVPVVDDVKISLSDVDTVDLHVDTFSTPESTTTETDQGIVALFTPFLP